MGNHCRKCGAAKSCHEQENEKAPSMIVNKTIDKVPEHLESKLPKHAQQIYVETFNYAYEEQKQQGQQDTEELQKAAHEAAWDEVNKRFDEDSKGKWHPRKQA